MLKETIITDGSITPPDNALANLKKLLSKRKIKKDLPNRSILNGVQYHTKVNFPSYIKLKQDVLIMDHLATAKRLFFDKFIYCICKTVEEAEDLYLTLGKMDGRNANNPIIKLNRLGPAFCAFQSKDNDLSVLRICKLHPFTTNDELRNIFPAAKDICTKKTMSKIVFADAKECQAAHKRCNSITWPHGAKPSVPALPVKSVDTESAQSLSSHPSRFANNPRVVWMKFARKFDLMLDLALIDVLCTAQEIVFSDHCTAVYDHGKEAHAISNSLNNKTCNGAPIKSAVVKVKSGSKKRDQDFDVGVASTENSDDVTNTKGKRGVKDNVYDDCETTDNQNLKSQQPSTSEKRKQPAKSPSHKVSKKVKKNII